MNKIIILFLMCISNISIAKECYDKKDYIKYFFINGVNVTVLDSGSSAELLRDSFHLKSDVVALYNPTLYQGGIKKWRDEINESQNILITAIKIPVVGIATLVHGLTEISSTLVFDVAMEVIPQKMIELDQLNLTKPTDKNDVQLARYINEKETGKLVSDYLTVMSSNTPNIVFAHSQGNLVSNQLCKKKGTIEMEIVSIASPAGELPCNTLKNYALYDYDFIITPLRLKFPNFAYLPTNFSGLNHFLDGYLSDEKVMSHLSSNLEKSRESYYDKNLKFDLISINLNAESELSPDGKESQLKYQELNEKRRKITKEITLMFGVSIFDKTFSLDKKRISIKERNTRDFNKIIDIPINAHSDQELKDFLVNVRKDINHVCERVEYINMPKDFSLKICNYLKSNIVDPLRSNYKGMSLTAFEQLNKKEIKISCMDAVAGKSSILLDYVPNSSKSQKISLNINGTQSDIEIKPTAAPYRSSINLSDVVITKNDDKSLSLSISEVIKDIGAREIASVEKKGDSKNKASGYHECYTFRKLASSYCEEYLRNLFKN